jgi:hypothetical protein
MALEAEQRRLAAEQAAAELKGQTEAAALASASRQPAASSSGAGTSAGEGPSTSSAARTNELLHRPFPEPHSLDLPAMGGAWPGEGVREAVQRWTAGI